ncbi:hypothetical protein [Microbacterium alcoholitolerans]|uniref:hypothetical protein n=1 Tax=unclassified Microbacterium TaxID=2609290 RepID=UPI003D17B619
MMDSVAQTDEPTRLDRAITWTGVGAATALAALFMMGSFSGFESSAPRADNIGEEGIAVAIGVFCLLVALAVALPAGWRLGRSSNENARLALRALPLLISVAWVILARALLTLGLQLVSGMWIEWIALHQFVLFSVFSGGALPIGIGLLVTFFVLIAVRSYSQRVDSPVA